MVEFNEDNITRRTNLESGDSLSAYRGHTAQQNPNTFKVFHKFLNEIRPKRILEIGTGMGGFTMFLRTTSIEVELDLDILTYDINGRQGYDSLKEYNIDVRTDNIFLNDYSDVLSEVIDFIQQEGITVILCDGGNKISEFKILSKYLKTGDFIMAHDYAPNEKYYIEHIYKKHWNWFEIHDSDIEDAVNKYNLNPFMEDEFRTAVWVCKIKQE